MLSIERSRLNAGDEGGMQSDRCDRRFRVLPLFVLPTFRATYFSCYLLFDGAIGYPTRNDSTRTLVRSKPP